MIPAHAIVEGDEEVSWLKLSTAKEIIAASHFCVCVASGAFDHIKYLSLKHWEISYAAVNGGRNT